jgi:hypothetical protein
MMVSPSRIAFTSPGYSSAPVIVNFCPRCTVVGLTLVIVGSPASRMPSKGYGTAQTNSATKSAGAARHHRPGRAVAGQGNRAAADDLLTPLYDGFTEGFDTHDLNDAKALLDELC